jgi:hypothetical protein
MLLFPSSSSVSSNYAKLPRNSGYSLSSSSCNTFNGADGSAASLGFYGCCSEVLASILFDEKKKEKYMSAATNKSKSNCNLHHFSGHCIIILKKFTTPMLRIAIIISLTQQL